MKLLLLPAVFLIFSLGLFSQNNFKYRVELQPVNITNMPGIHSYAFAQHDGKWLLIGGRLDGLHARQPFNAFPENQNNTSVFVVDVEADMVWSSTITVLSTDIREQMQSTNMNFYQDEDTLYIAGGYAYATSAADHITFPFLTSIDVPGLINAVVNGNSIVPFFKQINDPVFAITGGQLGKINDTFYLVGGHRFDGRYNPMGNPTFTQTYSNAIRKFKIDNSGGQLSFNNYSEILDQVHLRRRDYNLLPQVFPGMNMGYTISSGVFQINADLPFLYPVEITSSGHTPITGFNQYLSNYHSAKATIYNANDDEMYALFFGGMSQYYYDNGALIQDDDVPFVNTISLLTRFSDGSYQEAKLQEEMPGLKGASAEFILNESIPHFSNEVLQMQNFTGDTIVIGHVVGGIVSPSLNPFANNATNTTSADASVYEVQLIFDELAKMDIINVDDATLFEVYPNPAKDKVNLKYDVAEDVSVIRYIITDVKGRIIQQDEVSNFKPGINEFELDVSSFKDQVLNITLIFDDVYYNSQKLILSR